jgi:hypothetical protein
MVEQLLILESCESGASSWYREANSVREPFYPFFSLFPYPRYTVLHIRRICPHSKEREISKFFVFTGPRVLSLVSVDDFLCVNLVLFRRLHSQMTHLPV